MNPETVETLMNDLEAGDPLDFSDLSIGHREARRLMACHLCELDGQLAGAGLGAEERVAIMAAIAAHTLEANFLLHLRRLGAAEAPFDLKRWMAERGFG